MPIFLPAPEAPAAGPDGKGWNRLSLNAHFGFPAQCALRPRTWGGLIIAQDTRRAVWGNHGRCIRRGQCDGCPVRTALYDQCTVVPVNAARVLVRVEIVYAPGTRFTGPAGYRLWMTTGPDDRDYQHRTPWTWEDATRVRGWELGPFYCDELGEGFWLERTEAVPATGCTVITRHRPHSTLHGIRVARTRIAHLHCTGGCAHGPELLNALTHACPGPEGADENRVPVRWSQVSQMGPAPSDRLHFFADVQNMHVTLSARRDAFDERARITLTGSGWTLDRVRAVRDALAEHLHD